MEEKEKIVDINFFRPNKPHLKAQVKSASAVLILWALCWMSTPVILKLSGDEKGIGPLTKAVFLGFPLHYWLVAQGTTVGFVILCMLFVILWDKMVKTENQEQV